MDSQLFLDTLLQRSPPHILEHARLVLVPLGLAVLLAFPIGVFLTRPQYRRYAGRVMAVLNAGQTVPPLAVIAVFLPFLGLGFRPAVIALTIYALLPIARNTIAGISSVSEDVKEAARGMGMTPWEVFTQVELLLGLPVIMVGIKTSAVLTVGTAVLAALVGGRGMGAVIFAGINFFRPELILAGTLIIGLMAIILERLLTLAEWFILPRHLR